MTTSPSSAGLFRIALSLDHAVDVVSANPETEAVRSHLGTTQGPQGFIPTFVTKPKRHRFDILALDLHLFISDSVEPVLRTMPAGCRELHPAIINGGPWHLWVVQETLDVLDFEKTEFRLAGNITLGVVNAVLKAELPAHPCVFQLLMPGRIMVEDLPPSPSLDIYCNGAAAELLRPIRGLELKENLYGS